MHRLFPEEQINVTPSRSAIVLSGHVTTEDVSKHAGALAAAYSKNVVNVLTFGPVGAEEVLLQVKFAEVDRTALTQLGVNLLSTGSGNTIGTTTTGQFGGPLLVALPIPQEATATRFQQRQQSQTRSIFSSLILKFTWAQSSRRSRQGAFYRFWQNRISSRSMARKRAFWRVENSRFP